MKRIIILGSKNSGDKNDPKRLKSGLRGEFEASVAYWEDLIFEISTKKQSVVDSASHTDFKEADLVVAVNWYQSGSRSIYRDIAYTLALYLKQHNRQFWNSEMLAQRSTTKLSTLMLLAQEGVDVPATRFSLDPKNMTIGNTDLPVIVKDLAASRGRNNFLLKSEEELAKQLNSQSGFNRYLLQEFIPNDSDLRIICFGGEPNMVIRRSRQGDQTHLNNTSTGGKAELVGVDNLSEPIHQACRKICAVMGRELAGIDLIESNDGLSRQVFLEVNAVPQLTSGTYVEQKLNGLSDSLAKLSER